MPDERLPASAVLTHHWLVRQRGGEKVLEALAEFFPHAPVYTLVAEPTYMDPGGGEARWRGHRVHSTVLRWLPRSARYYPALLPLMPFAAGAMHLPAATLVVSSDAALAKAMRPAKRSVVVCYCHSPMRYIWEDAIAGQYAATLPRPLRPLWPLLRGMVRRADARAAKRVDLFIANSQTVAGRIARAYGRQARVIYPPVAVTDAPAAGPREDFYLCVGYHVAYKRLDLAVAACTALGRRLVVIGEGPEVSRARALAGPSVEFLGYQPDGVVEDHLRRAAALLFPGEEDFGIVPVEAMGHGCPVIAFGKGGATESVVDGETGVLFEQQDVAGLSQAIVQAEAMTFAPERLHARALRFSHDRFRCEVRAALADALAGQRS